MIWLCLAVVWLLTFVNADKVRSRYPLAALGVIAAVSFGIAVFNAVTVDDIHVTSERLN